MTAQVTIELDAQFPAQDYVLIGGDRSPGKCTIRNTHSPRGWDIRQGYGQTGAVVVPKGDGVATFEILFEIFDAADVPAWYAFAANYFDRAVKYYPGQLKPKTLGISHPQLSAPPLRVTQVIVLDTTGLEQDDDDLGGWHATVQFQEYRPPVMAAAPPDAAIPAAAPPQPTAEDAADAAINQKLDTATSLAKAQGLL